MAVVGGTGSGPRGRGDGAAFGAAAAARLSRRGWARLPAHGRAGARGEVWSRRPAEGRRCRERTETDGAQRVGANSRLELRFRRDPGIQGLDRHGARGRAEAPGRVEKPASALATPSGASGSPLVRSPSHTEFLTRLTTTHLESPETTDGPNIAQTEIAGPVRAAGRRPRPGGGARLVRRERRAQESPQFRGAAEAEAWRVDLPPRPRPVNRHRVASLRHSQRHGRRYLGRRLSSPRMASGGRNRLRGTCRQLRLGLLQGLPAPS